MPSAPDQTIRAAYPCSYNHDEDSLKAVLAELTKADMVRSLREAPAPEQANEISIVGYENEESDDDDNTYLNSAYAASSLDDS